VIFGLQVRRLAVRVYVRRLAVTVHVRRLAVTVHVSKCRKALETFHLYWKYICRNIQGGKQ
jgi:hypothetical protein